MRPETVSVKASINKIGLFAMRAILTFIFLFLSTVGLSAADKETKRPNVLFILTDDQRFDALSCMGHPHLKTPHIDRLAKEGLLFKNHYCTTSLCSPSRASILSGLYAHSHGVSNNFTEYPTEMVSFPMRLQESGYQTAYVGKWHMGEKNDNPRPGFDYFVTHKGQGKYFDNEFNFNGKERKVVKGYYTKVVTDFTSYIHVKLESVNKKKCPLGVSWVRTVVCSILKAVNLATPPASDYEA